MVSVMGDCKGNGTKGNSRVLRANHFIIRIYVLKDTILINGNFAGILAIFIRSNGANCERLRN